MLFDEWWATKDVGKAYIPGVLKEALKELAYEAWCESRYQLGIADNNLCTCTYDPATGQRLSICSRHGNT